MNIENLKREELYDYIINIKLLKRSISNFLNEYKRGITGAFILLFCIQIMLFFLQSADGIRNIETIPYFLIGTPFIIIIIIIFAFTAYSNEKDNENIHLINKMVCLYLRDKYSFTCNPNEYNIWESDLNKESYDIDEYDDEHNDTYEFQEVKKNIKEGYEYIKELIGINFLEKGDGEISFSFNYKSTLSIKSLKIAIGKRSKHSNVIDLYIISKVEFKSDLYQSKLSNFINTFTADNLHNGKKYDFYFSGKYLYIKYYYMLNSGNKKDQLVDYIMEVKNHIMIANEIEKIGL